ncbi:MAG: TSUP family transporter, partial [Bacteroidota bacterium]
LIGLLMIFFAVYEFFPFLEGKLKPGKKLWLGGIISGFFGGLTGHQGALRSAWLIKFIKEKQVYVATGTVIACLVDVSRLGVYWTDVDKINFNDNWNYLLFPVMAACIGAFFGNKLLKKITLNYVKILVCILLVVFGLLTGLGVLSK